jgi:predicted metalloprotease
MGPFYCPADSTVYIDLSFYQDMRDKLGADGDFAQAYVIAHEVGHHVQNQLGITGRVDGMRGRVSEAQMNALSVRVELQADCFAGVWAHHSQQGKGWLERGDIEEALNAAAQIGDDTLQRRSQGTVVPESFTHGTSAQRQTWFRRGLESGSVNQCNTFEGRL